MESVTESELAEGKEFTTKDEFIKTAESYFKNNFVPMNRKVGNGQVQYVCKRSVDRASKSTSQGLRKMQSYYFQVSTLILDNT